MKYRDMIQAAIDGGKTSEKTMWSSVADVEELLEEIRDEYPEKYWCFMRKQYGILNHGHYGEDFAVYDVDQMEYADAKGDKHVGAYWTQTQIEDATRGMSFPSGTTKWDKYVAFNSFRADTMRSLSDEDALKAAHEFYFCDADYTGEGSKIWHYMCAMRKA